MYMQNHRPTPQHFISATKKLDLISIMIHYLDKIIELLSLKKY